jgi:DNA-binding NarL/FixJ family response regulator
MHDSVFQILFLVDTSSWSKLSQALLDAPHAPLRVHRLDSLADLFRALAAGRSHALVVDVHARNFQGLHYVEKVRSEYPSFPIVALHTPSIPDLDAKATTCGASCCIALDQLTIDSLHRSVASILADSNSQFVFQKSSHTLPPNSANPPALVFSKNQVITHALNNLLCVISANADLLSDTLNPSGPDARPLTEIKKAAKSAAALMRHLK